MLFFLKFKILCGVSVVVVFQYPHVNFFPFNFKENTVCSYETKSLNYIIINPEHLKEVSSFLNVCNKKNMKIYSFFHIICGRTKFSGSNIHPTSSYYLRWSSSNMLELLLVKFRCLILKKNSNTM